MTQPTREAEHCQWPAYARPQVDMATSGIVNSSLAIQEVLRLKAHSSCMVRILAGCASQVGMGEVCAAISERLVLASPEAVQAWLL
jgi:hypothetical protein